MKNKKAHKVIVSNTGAWAIRQASGIDKRGGPVKNKKKEMNRKACRKNHNHGRSTWV